MNYSWQLCARKIHPWSGTMRALFEKRNEWEYKPIVFQLNKAKNSNDLPVYPVRSYQNIESSVNITPDKY